MSKKKAAGGSTTMTLKDFHGGSIPTDLPLPSAPGVTARPLDRPGFDRQGSWGNPMGRSDHRLRPGSAGAVRNYDDKTPFLSPNAHIGRNFDEDERKPLDGAPGPRRTISDDSIRPLPMRTEPKPGSSSAFKSPSLQVLSAGTQVYSAGASTYAGRVSEVAHGGGSSQNIGGNSSFSARFGEVANLGLNSPKSGGNGGIAASGPFPNAWVTRKEAVSIAEPLPATWSGLDAASKLAHASALDKVSSGRWQSKQPIHHPANVEPIRHTEIESEFSPKSNTFNNTSSYRAVDVAGGVEYQDAMLVRHVERSSVVNVGVRGGGKEFPAYERAIYPMYSDTVEGNPSSYGGQPSHNDSKFGGTGFPSPMPLEQSERPKLKLLPRSKPLESSDPPVDNNHGYHQPENYDHLNTISESYQNGTPVKTGLIVSDNGNLEVERPKLNLKPRSQPTEQGEETAESGRNTVFGGARPRELVLKERGVDDIAVNNHDVVQPLTRVKQDVPRTEIVPAHATPSRYNDRAEGIPFDNRVRKNNEKRDNRVDVERTDMQKRNWRSDNRKSFKESEKHQNHQLPQERPPSPETWRKPVEQPKPASPDGSGVRYGKAASAVELAQAFSKSVSDPKVVDRISSERGVPRHSQIPFSRLMDPTSRPQINGY